MNNTVCGFSSLNDMLSKARSDNLNVTEVVQNCTDICTLVWGHGNPDLSGIGANVSYIIQVVFVIMFGPVFVAVYGMRKRWNLREKVVHHLETLHNTFVDANAQFSIPVAVATVVRIKQGAPLYEVTFLQSLTTMQFLGMLCAIVASGVVKPRMRPRRIFLLTLYGLMEFSFYMGLVAYLRTSKQNWTQIKELGTACKGYGRIVPGFAYAAESKIPHITAAEAFKPWSKKSWIIFGLVAAGIVGLIIAVLLLILLFLMLTSKHPLLLGPMSLAFAIGTLYCLVQMEAKRITMKKLTGNEFQDNEWGFGQVISLFLWAPLIIQMIYYAIVRPFDSTPPPSNAEIESNRATSSNHATSLPSKPAHRPHKKDARRAKEKDADTKEKPKEGQVETSVEPDMKVDEKESDSKGINEEPEVLSVAESTGGIDVEKKAA